MVNIITKETLRQKAIDLRKVKVQANIEKGNLRQELGEKFLAELDRNEIPKAAMGEDFNPKHDIRTIDEGGRTVAEFTGMHAGNFAADFFTRQQYEVQAGRDEEPLLFPQIYSVVEDMNLPETLEIFTMSDDDVGVIFDRIDEGGQVKFASVSGASKTVKQVQWAAGIEYSKRLFKFGSGFFQMPLIERAFGRAANARQNHAHLSPILEHTYIARQQTDGGAITKFRADASLVEKYHITIDEAIANSRLDATARRAGPYAILCAVGDLSTIRKALTNVDQRGFQLVSPEVIDSVRTIITYDGWIGSRGNESVSFAGVTAGKSYLINMSHREFDFQSFYSQPLMRESAGGDKTRFIVEQVVWDMWFGLYSAPSVAVEEITWPTAEDGVVDA
jgi:hypothetical protein